MRRLKRRAGNANMEMRPVIPRPRRWTRSYVQNGLKHARKEYPAFVFDAVDGVWPPVIHQRGETEGLHHNVLFTFPAVSIDKQHHP